MSNNKITATPHGEYFSFHELTRSATGDIHGVDNLPTDEAVLDNLQDLADALDAIREAWGAPILVNSGYRSPKVNELLGGVKTSSHLYGLAADIQPQKGSTMKAFWEWLREDWAKDNAFDQLIGEQIMAGRPSWVHFGLRRYDGSQRRQILET